MPKPRAHGDATVTQQTPAKILLVDDQPNNLLALEEILADVDAELLRASSGNEALNLMTQHEVALVLLDVQMPEMDGFEVACLMRLVEKSKRIPIIFVTAADKSREMTFRGYESGGVDYIHKPINEDVLRSKVAIFLEIFEQKQRIESQNAELEMRVAERTADLRVALVAAEAAARAKGEFLACMSHELKTPMNSILGFTARLTKGLKGQIDDRSYDSLETVERNARQLLELINSLLDSSKLEAGLQQIETIACSPVAILAEVKSLLQPGAIEKGLTFDVEFDGPIPELIQSDPTRVRQILINLVGNAIKFTSAGGIRVVTRISGVSSETSVIRFDVIDTGIGMSDEAIGTLFELFVQGDSATNRKFGGTGLGLAISKRLAELLQGDIRVTSVPGQGSTFTVSIPTGPLQDVAMIDNPLADASVGG